MSPTFELTTYRESPLGHVAEYTFGGPRDRITYRYEFRLCECGTWTVYATTTWTVYATTLGPRGGLLNAHTLLACHCALAGL